MQRRVEDLRVRVVLEGALALGPQRRAGPAGRNRRHTLVRRRFRPLVVVVVPGDHRRSLVPRQQRLDVLSGREHRLLAILAVPARRVGGIVAEQEDEPGLRAFEHAFEPRVILRAALPVLAAVNADQQHSAHRLRPVHGPAVLAGRIEKLRERRPRAVVIAPHRVERHRGQQALARCEKLTVPAGVPPAVSDHVAGEAHQVRLSLDHRRRNSRPPARIRAAVTRGDNAEHLLAGEIRQANGERAFGLGRLPDGGHRRVGQFPRAFRNADLEPVIEISLGRNRHLLAGGPGGRGRDGHRGRYVRAGGDGEVVLADGAQNRARMDAGQRRRIADQPRWYLRAPLRRGPAGNERVLALDEALGVDRNGPVQHFCAGTHHRLPVQREFPTISVRPADNPQTRNRTGIAHGERGPGHDRLRLLRRRVQWERLSLVGTVGHLGIGQQVDGLRRVVGRRRDEHAHNQHRQNHALSHCRSFLSTGLSGP